MNANLPRSYKRLPPSEQQHIKNLAYDIAREQFEHDVMIVLDQFIKMSCQALHATFGFGEKRMTYYLASYRRLFKRYIKANKDGIMLGELDRQMRHIFRRDGYPDHIFNTMFENWTIQTEKGEVPNG